MLESQFNLYNHWQALGVNKASQSFCFFVLKIRLQIAQTHVHFVNFS